jgi:hypothetical protein
MSNEERKREREIGSAKSCLFDIYHSPFQLDPEKIGNANVDTDENAYQLALACQKIFNVIKQNDALVPDEIRMIFIKLSDVIMMKFGSEEGCFKAIGGLLFLRYKEK